MQVLGDRLGCSVPAAKTFDLIQVPVVQRCEGPAQRLLQLAHVIEHVVRLDGLSSNGHLHLVGVAVQTSGWSEITAEAVSRFEVTDDSDLKHRYRRKSGRHGRRTRGYREATCTGTRPPRRALDA